MNILKYYLMLICVLLIAGLYSTERILIRIPHPSAELLQQYQIQNADIAAYLPAEYLDLVWPVSELEELRRQHPELIVRCSEAEMKANLQSSQRDLPGYRNYQQLLDEIYVLAALNPALVQIEVIGSSWGKSYAAQNIPAYLDFDHDIHAIKVSANVAVDEDEPAFYFVGTHHAREPISLEMTVAILNDLVSGYGFDAQITDILNSSQVWIVPLLNPDGHKIVIDETDIWWRKNLRDNNGNGSIDTVNQGYGYDGVDLNRNYGHMWGNISASDNPYSVTYHGPNPFSEPETIAFRSFLEAHPFVAGISYHSYGEYVLYPYGYAHYLYAPDSDELGALAEAMASSIHCIGPGYYTALPSFGLYPVSGSLDDWAYGARGIFAYTIEMANQFIPPAAQLPGILQNHLSAAKTLLQRKDSKTLCGHITAAATGEPLPAMIFVDGIDDHYLPRAAYHSNATFGSYWRFLPVGWHRVSYVAEGYLSQSFLIQISDSGQSVQDVALELAAQITQSIRVFDDLRSPISGAKLSLASATFYSDAQGYILLNDISAGDYQIQLGAAGYASLKERIPMYGNDLEFVLTGYPLFSDGFEEGIGNWFTTSSWGISHNEAFSGSKSLSDSPAGDYDNYANSYCHTVQAIDLRGYEQVNLQFVAKVNTVNDGDYFSVGYKASDESVNKAIALIHSSEDWTHYDLDLSFLAGQQIQLYFTFRSGSSDTADGIYIDDVAVYGSSNYVENEDLVSSALSVKLGPNPFVQQLVIELNKQDATAFSVDIYNLRGQKVQHFTNKSLTSGQSFFVWDGRDHSGQNVASGVYFLRLTSSDGKVSSRKVLKLK